ncbi:MAG: 4-hydroxy-tetrahydrodipicolinate synthase [Bacteroidota bacterium]
MIEKMMGTGVALVTPFDETLNVDFQGLKNLLEYIAKSNVHYLVVHGTTGEATTTTPEERSAILSFVQTHNANNLPIVYGISGNDTREVINTVKKTHFEGVDAILLANPHYNRPSQEGLYQHCKAIADACPIPVLLYNIPARTGTNMLAKTTLQLSKHPNIIGIKEASGDLLQCMEIAQGKDDDFLIISGEDMLTLPMIAIGAVGVISAIANAFPKTMHDIVDAALRNNNAAAQIHTWKLLPIAQRVGVAGNPVGTKQLLAVLNICKNYVRRPLVVSPLSLTQEEMMRIITLQEDIT